MPGRRQKPPNEAASSNAGCFPLYGWVQGFGVRLWGLRLKVLTRYSQMPKSALIL